MDCHYLLVNGRNPVSKYKGKPKFYGCLTTDYNRDGVIYGIWELHPIDDLYRHRLCIKAEFDFLVEYEKMEFQDGRNNLLSHEGTA